MTNKRINFSIDKFELIEDSQNSQLAKLKLWICREGNNLHEMPISWETIQMAAHTLVGKPILANYRELYDDFGSHDPEESPVGVFIKESDINEETDADGNRWLTSIGYVWKKYFPNVFRVLERNKDDTSVSMEIELLDGGENKTSIDIFSFMGVTLLGKGIQPAIPNARAMLSFSKLVKETEEILSHEKENFSSGYKGIDFTIPEEVKMTSSKGLKLYENFKRGGNGYSLSMARYLSTRTDIEPSRVKKLHRALSNKSKQDMSENTDAHISFALMGGKSCMIWCKEIMSQMENADSNKLSHFTLNAEDGKEMEDNKLKKNFEEKEEVVEKKMAEEEEEKKEEKPFADEEKKEEEKPFAKEEEEKMAKDAEEEKPFAKEEEEKKDEKPFADEEEKEKPAEEDKEEARMSLNGYADVTAQLSMLGMETQTAEQMSDAFAKAPEAEKQFTLLVSKVKELFEQNVSLKEYKSEIEKKQFAHLVESTLLEVVDIMPKEKIAECRLSSANFTLETISAWQNEVKAIAFSFAKDGKLKKEDDGVSRFALPFTNIPKKEGSTSLWG